MINKLCLICQTNKRVGINMFKDFSLWKTTTKIETYSSSPVLRGLLAQVYQRRADLLNGGGHSLDAGDDHIGR